MLLRQAYPDSTVAQRRVVARAAGDLADSGQFDGDRGVALTPQTVVEELADAPDGLGLVERWNWWVNALEVAHGRYEQFRIDRFQDAEG